MDVLGASILDWWAEAGVDCIVDDEPRNWLAPARAETVAPAAPPVAAPAALPADLTEYARWLLASGDVPGPAGGRVGAAGDPASGTMIVVDMPEAEDRASGCLVSGPAGEVFDRMLGAAQLDRDRIYLAPLAPARPATGRIDVGHVEALARLMRHHVALVRPRRLLIFGDAASRALLGQTSVEAGGKVHQLTVADLTVPTVATIHPRLMTIVSDATKQRRQASWRDLQLFMAL